jgi:hypothetical protein
MKLGIIGTAGRKEDGERLKLGHWILMNSVAETLALALNVKGFVSGGAAYADHVAVSLYLKYDKKFSLSLHLPAELTITGFMQGFDKYDAGRTSNYYHELFSKQIGIDSIQELVCAASFCDTTVSADFKSRNTLVANEADVLLAFTFGNGSILKDGGTKDTMEKFWVKRDAEEKRLIELSKTFGVARDENPHRAFHYDLNSKRLFEI